MVKKFTSNLSRLVDPDSDPNLIEGIGAASMFVRHQLDEETKRIVQKQLGIIPGAMTITENSIEPIYETNLTIVPTGSISRASGDEKPTEEDFLVKIVGHCGEVEILPRKVLKPAPSKWNFFGKPPRHKFEEMLKSIHRYGLFQPIIVWEQTNGTYMILGGHTRELIFDELFQATGDEKWLEIMCRIYRHDDLTELEAIEIVMDSNYAQRSDLNPVDRSKCYWAKSRIYKSRTQYGDGIDINAMVAKHYNVNRDTVCTYKKLDNLIPEFGQWMEDGKLGSSNASKLAAFDHSTQSWLLEKYQDQLTPNNLSRLTKRMTTDEIEVILTALSEDKKFKMTIELENRPPKDRVPFLLFVKQEELKSIKIMFRALLESSATNEDTRKSLLSQLD